MDKALSKLYILKQLYKDDKQLVANVDKAIPLMQSIITRATELENKKFSVRPELIRAFRISLGMTRETFADEIGFTYHSVGAWERGQRVVRDTAITMITNRFPEFEKWIKKYEDEI